MINIALLAISAFIILCIARYNKSNKLFWQLLMAFVIGFACGHCGNIVKNINTSKKSSIITAPTYQSSDVNVAIVPETSEETSITYAINYTGQSYYNRDIELSTSMASAPGEKTRGGPPEYVNTS